MYMYVHMYVLHLFMYSKAGLTLLKNTGFRWQNTIFEKDLYGKWCKRIPWPRMYERAEVSEPDATLHSRQIRIKRPFPDSQSVNLHLISLVQRESRFSNKNTIAGESCWQT